MNLILCRLVTQGCGYPPNVNCSTWIRQYGVLDSTFPCYYARTNQSIAITHLDTKSDLRDLLMSTCIPLAACFISGLALCMMHTNTLKCISTVCHKHEHKYKSVRIDEGNNTGHENYQNVKINSSRIPKKSILASRYFPIAIIFSLQHVDC